MLPSWSDLATHIHRAHRAESLDELCRSFRDIVAPFQIDALACGRAHLLDRRLATFFIIDWPENWRNYYMESGFIQRDPLLDHLQTATEPFTWSELRRDRRLSKAGSEALGRTAEHGWTEGIVVPVDIAPPFAGLVSLVARRSAFTVEEKAFLTLISVNLYQRAKDLALTKGPTLAPARLTTREIACLQLIAQGYSDRRIGEELGISTATAHEHFESAKKKLNATTRSTAISTALSLSVIRPH